MNHTLTVIALLALAPATAYAADPITAITWNVESDGADPGVIARQLRELPKATIFALQEVDPRDVNRYGDAIRKSHGKSYRFFAGWTGRNDRLMVAFDSDRLRLQHSSELHEHNGNAVNDWRHRSPLSCLFRDTVDDKPLGLIVVHLARGDAKFREEQARALSYWPNAEQVPSLMVGDFNFDYSFKRRRGNSAFDAFEEGNTGGMRKGAKVGMWKWAKPEKLVDTNWSDRDGDGRDNYPDSCLDFVFYTDAPKDLIAKGFVPQYCMKVTSEVLVRNGDFPDDDRTSDHRPVMATIHGIEYLGQ